MKIIHGDCIEELKKLPENSVDSVVTDPPYGIGFMGKAWDTFKPDEVQKKAEVERKRKMIPLEGLAHPQNHTVSSFGAASYAGMYDLSPKGVRNYQSWCEEWARECLRVLKPGGHLLASNSPRMYHRMVSGIEDGGFEIRDTIAWVYGSGFPKSHNLHGDWEGWGSALKPAFEPIVIARKPFKGTLKENVLTHGTGGLNIDGCRVGTEGGETHVGGFQNEMVGGEAVKKVEKDLTPRGRWPANLIHDGSEEVLECFPNTGSAKKARNGIKGGSIIHDGGCKVDVEGYWPADTGGSAARFFKECKYTNEELWPHQSNNDQPVKSAENPSGLCETSTAPKAVATLEALKGSESHEESPASPASIGSSESSFLNQNPVSSAENQENTDTTQTTQSSMRSSGSAPLATGESTKQESQSVVNVQVQGMRLVYQAKASKKDRDEGLEGFENSILARSGGAQVAEAKGEEYSEGQGIGLNRVMQVKNNHPTVKPTALMRYLVKLVTPPGGTVLDPFAGSGSTGKACKLEGFEFIGIEREEEYVKIAEARIAAVTHQPTLV